MEISVGIADVPIKIETKHLLTTSLELWCWTTVLGVRPLCSQYWSLKFHKRQEARMTISFTWKAAPCGHLDQLWMLNFTCGTTMRTLNENIWKDMMIKQWESGEEEAKLLSLLEDSLLWSRKWHSCPFFWHSDIKAYGSHHAYTKGTGLSVTLLTHIQEVLGLNLGWDSSSPDWGLSWVSSVPSD
jgi:hypothetical protein